MEVKITASRLFSVIIFLRPLSRLSYSLSVKGKGTLDPFVNWYRCSDGKWIMLNEPHPDRIWSEFCQTLGIPHLEEDPMFYTLKARLENAAAFRDILIETFASKRRKDWETLFTARRVKFVYTLVNTVAEAAENQQLSDNEYIVPFEHPTIGSTRTTGLPVKFSKTPGSVGTAAPEFGQHTEEILLDICGYNWEKIEDLRDQGVI